MCKKKKPLSKTEFEFMEFIWKHPTGIQSGEIFKHFSQVRSTQSNILKNIVAKGFLTVQQKGLHFLYIPNITKEEYQKMFSEQRVGKLEKLILSFFQQKKLSEDEISRLQDFLEDLKNE